MLATKLIEKERETNVFKRNRSTFGKRVSLFTIRNELENKNSLEVERGKSNKHSVDTLQPTRMADVAPQWDDVEIQRI